MVVTRQAGRDRRTFRPRRRSFGVWLRSLSPARLLVVSFLGLIAFGTLGLRLLPGLYVEDGLGWLDALFTATSAVCVTGLIVVDTATYFTPAGQAFLLLLIQLGGLGILAFTTLIILALGMKLSLHQEALTANVADISEDVDVRTLARAVVIFTLTIEGIAALALWLAWVPRLGAERAIWHAIFHAVSAFCNAGFSTFTTNLMEFQESPAVLGVIMGCIVLGGLGFLTIQELHLMAGRSERSRRFRLSLHSRIVLSTTAVLLVGGWLAFAVIEWRTGLGGMPPGARVLNALFMSVTARTAGFNTVDYMEISDSGAFLTILLMSIGGAPGSTAGGIKVTTFALLGLLAWARLRGRERTHVSNRTVPEETIQRAVGLFVVAFVVVTAGIMMFAALEMGGTAHALTTGNFLVYMFEAVSAFNTVGLSMGATPELDPSSRLLTVLLMYVGRVGPLTFAAAIALSRPSPEGEFRYSYEDVIIG